MSETDTITIPDLDLGADDGDSEARVSLKRSDIRKLEAAAKAGVQAQKSTVQAQRELAFYRAGLDPSDKRLSYFVKGYEGELTPEAIKAEAEQAGFTTQAPAAPAAPSGQPGEAGAEGGDMADLRAAALAGGAIPPGSDASLAAGRQALQEAMAQGGLDAMMAKARELGLPIAGEV